MRLQVRVQESLVHLCDMSLDHLSLNSDKSSMGVACVVPPLAAVASLATASSSPCPRDSRVAGAVHARRTATPMHALDAHNSWSDMVRVQFPTGRRCTKGGVSSPSEDLRPVSEVEAAVNFGRPACTGAGCRFTSQEATRHRSQACQGRCGHTFPSTRRFLVSNSCHLDTDWTSGNRWAGRRCVVPHGRGFGC